MERECPYRHLDRPGLWPHRSGNYPGDQPEEGRMVHCTAYCPVGTVVNLTRFVNPFRMYIDNRELHRLHGLYTGMQIRCFKPLGCGCTQTGTHLHALWRLPVFLPCRLIEIPPPETFPHRGQEPIPDYHHLASCSHHGPGQDLRPFNLNKYSLIFLSSSST